MSYYSVTLKLQPPAAPHLGGISYRPFDIVLGIPHFQKDHLALVDLPRPGAPNHGCLSNAQGDCRSGATNDIAGHTIADRVLVANDAEAEGGGGGQHGRRTSSNMLPLSVFSDWASAPGSSAAASAIAVVVHLGAIAGRGSELVEKQRSCVGA